MSSHQKLPLRYMLYSFLWMSFLWFQIVLFAPLEEESPGAIPLLTSGMDFDPDPAAGRALVLRTNPHPKQTTTRRRKPGHAIFNNIDVYYKESSTLAGSDYHCIGRELDDPAINANFSWMFRSCQFQHLCLDTETHEFLLVKPQQDQPLPPLAIGAINPRWSGRGFNKGFHKVKWSPKTVDTLPGGGYYELPDDVVLVPFHSMAAHNVGHLLWDDFYPIYTLLEVFGLGNNHQHLLLRWTAEGKLYATCEMQRKKSIMCQENFQRFLPLLGIDPQTFSTVKKAQLRRIDLSEQPLKSKYVCAKQAVAGIGMLMDHGMRDHGWVLRDPNSGRDLVPHNLGRGALFRQFRDFMVQNMGFPLQLPAGSRRKITFSTHSSKGFERSLSFENQTARIAQALQQSTSSVTVQSITMRELSLQEQIQVALESAIFITVCGGGAVTATFLPTGSTLIVYYPEDGGFDFWQYNYTYTPARLDWDLLTNAAHIKVHWLPMKTMETRQDLLVLEKLVLHELRGMGLLS